MSTIQELANALKNHKRVVFFGGAGVSTESHIPDFRGKDGLYNQKTSFPWTPEEMLSRTFFDHHREEFYKYMYSAMAKGIYEASPNRAHYALAELEDMGILSAVVTQNIDGLHQRAGSKHVIELHGTTYTNTCVQCGASYSLKDFLELEGKIPSCRKCGGAVRPDIVLYEEPLDMNVIDDAIHAISHADMMIIGGTSLVVYPAAGMIRYFQGDTVAIINRDPTPSDNLCQLVYRESVGEVLEGAVKLIRS